MHPPSFNSIASPHTSHASRVALGAFAALLPIAALAADAHRAVNAKPGEIIVLRNVATRPAYRQTPAGVALIANPSPQRELDAALGTGELSEADYANLDASGGRQNSHATTVERMVGHALGDSLGTGTNAHGVSSTNGMSAAMAGPMGAMTHTTRGIGDQVQGALSQLQMMPAPAAGGR